MGIDRKRKRVEFELVDFAMVTKAWFDYYLSINKEYILSESSMRMPISDYLTQFSGEVHLEEDVGVFVNRKYDLFFERDEIVNFMEFKYVQPKYTSSVKEKQRYFNDIMRLRARSNEKNTNCYLVVCGRLIDFLEEMKIYPPNPSTFSPYTKNVNDDDSYRNMLSFYEGGVKEIDFSENKIMRMKSQFYFGEKAHKLNEGLKKIFPNFFDDTFFRVKTTCVTFIKDDVTPTAVGIWQIEDNID